MLEPRPLTERQDRILGMITQYVRVTGEPCSANYLARRLDMHHSTVQEHLSALYRKGWIEGPSSPVRPRRWLSKR